MNLREKHEAELDDLCAKLGVERRGRSAAELLSDPSARRIIDAASFGPDGQHVLRAFSRDERTGLQHGAAVAFQRRRK